MDRITKVERRRGARRTTRVEAVMQLGAVRSHVMILDYEQGGLQLWVREALVPDMDITLHVSGYTLPARVQWYEGKCAGVQLLHPLDTDLQRMLDAAKGALPDVS